MPGTDYHGGVTPSWWGNTAPTSVVTKSANTWVGNQLQFDVPGRVFGFRVYLQNGAFHDMWGLCWTTAGTLYTPLAAFKYGTKVGTGWLQYWIRPTFRINTTDVFMVGVMVGGSDSYARTVNGLASGGVHNNGMSFQRGWQTTALDPISASFSNNANANGVDLLFQAD